MARTRQRIKTTKKTTTRRRSKSSTKGNGSGRLLLFASAIVVLLVVYRQVVLASYVRGQIPEVKLQMALETCLQQNVSLSQLSSLQSLKAKESMGISSSIGTLQGIFKDILNGVSAGVVQTEITAQYISEIKMLSLEDFFGQNAQMQINGAVDIRHQVPVIGVLEDHKQYQVKLNKRGEQFNFLQLSTRKDDKAEWTVWECSQQF